MSRRVCVISENLSGAPDEGIKKFALAFGRALADAHDVTLIGTRGKAACTLPGVRFAAAPSTFMSRSLRSELRSQQPEVIFYVPTASTTLMAFARSRMLKAFSPCARVVVIGLQPRPHPSWHRWLLRVLAPESVWVQSAGSRHSLERVGVAAQEVASGVDLEVFRPVDSARRAALRARYCLNADLPTVLHVGHLIAGRGIRALGALAARGGPRLQVVLVTSTSTRADQELAAELREQGVRLFCEYQPNVEHFYQLADCYVFPVPHANWNAIDVPLSVLEALACELPVVTTRFGGLEQVFRTGLPPGLLFINSIDTLADAVKVACGSSASGARAYLDELAWPRLATNLLARVFDK